MSRNLSFLIVLILVAPAFANDPSTGPRVGKVARLDVRLDGSVLFTLEGEPQMCVENFVANKGHALFTPGVFQVTPDGAKALLSILTAAKLSGRNVLVGTQITSSNTPYCVISSIQLQ